VHRFLSAVVAASAILAGLVGCSATKAGTAAPNPTVPAAGVPNALVPAVMPNVSVHDDPGAFYAPPSPLTPGLPGSIIRSEVVTGVAGIPAGATVWRVLYRSRSIYDADIAVSGYIVVPSGPAPPAGWKVLAWAHGTTGITPTCFPSRFDTSGAGHPYLVPDLAGFLARGYVVAATDYEGITGLEPYLLGASEGRGVLDAARAAVHLPGVHVSATTVIYGHSQGGHAALFAAELAPTYAPELRVIGVVAAAPATNLSLIMTLAGTPAGQAALSFLLEAGWSWVNAYTDLPASVLFTPEGIAQTPGLVAGCLGDTVRRIISGHVAGNALFNPDAPTNPTVLAHARSNDPGRVRTAFPILIVQGTADTTVPPALTDAYVQKMACPIGDTVEYLRFTGANHGSIPTAASSTVLAWMSDRVAGAPAPTTCAMPGDGRAVAA